MRGITRDCLAELLDRKTIWLFGFIAVISLAVLIGAFLLMNDREMQLDPAVEAGFDPGALFLTGFLRGFMWLMVFLAVMATAGEFPVMLQRGRADFYLSKPISRQSLYMNKLLGVWIVYGGFIAAVTLLLFAVGSIFSGSFDWHVVYTIGMNMLVMLLWLSITGFFGIISGSTVTAIMMAFVIWIVQMVLTLREDLIRGIAAMIGMSDAKVLNSIGDGLYYILPKPSQMYDMIGELADGEVTTWLPLWSSMLFAMALLLLAMWVFRRKDY